MTPEIDRIDREIFLAFWKIHILHRAEKGPVWGLGLLQELAELGYRLNPGTLYPVLSRMARNGWLRSERASHPKSRRPFRLTLAGKQVLERLRSQVEELHQEVVRETSRGR